MRHLALLIACLSLFVSGCGSTLTTPVRSSTALHSHMGSGTVALVFTDADGDVRPYCSGVWLSHDEILTAGHCAAAITRITQGLGEDEAVDPVNVSIHYIVQTEVDQVGKEPTAIHLGFVKAWDEDHDLALLKAVGETIPAHDSIEVVDELPGLGENIFIVGHPKGLYWSYIEGVVAAYRQDLLGRSGPFVQISAPVWFGNSGGGAFDYEGKLVGIASFLTHAPNTSFFIHPDSIKKFLKSVEDKAEQHKEVNSLDK